MRILKSSVHFCDRPVTGPLPRQKFCRGRGPVSDGLRAWGQHPPIDGCVVVSEPVPRPTAEPVPTVCPDQSTDQSPPTAGWDFTEGPLSQPVGGQPASQPVRQPASPPVSQSVSRGAWPSWPHSCSCPPSPPPPITSATSASPDPAPASSSRLLTFPPSVTVPAPQVSAAQRAPAPFLALGGRGGRQLSDTDQEPAYSTGGRRGS